MGLRPAGPADDGAAGAASSSGQPWVGSGGGSSLLGVALSAEQRAGLGALYEELQGSYPRSSACKRIPLDFLVGAGQVLLCGRCACVLARAGMRTRGGHAVCALGWPGGSSGRAAHELRDSNPGSRCGCCPCRRRVHAALGGPAVLFWPSHPTPLLPSRHSTHSPPCANIQEGDAFAAADDAYVRPFVQRGIPSLFQDLKPLYQ